jgi:hypothetical protein
MEPEVRGNKLKMGERYVDIETEREEEQKRTTI